MKAVHGYVRFDGMTWPTPERAGEIEWRLRYAPNPTRADLLFAASVCSAFRQLVRDPAVQRNRVVASLRNAAQPPEEASKELK